jgi:rRNA maturation protein Nop10
LDACKEKEKQLIIAEREKSSSAVKNLNADIRKNIKLDARRAAQNKEETDLREKISERGEIMRKNAGPIPFDPSDKTSHYDLEKASADAEKIKAEDARREAEHLRLMQKRAEEIQEDNI